jgi:antitoxin (DNA-binding transcriptional repressor) of toxin-antitoxin stability system
MTWYAAHKAKIEQARTLTAQGNPAAALVAIDEAEAIRQGRELEREEASRRAIDLLRPQRIRAALEALDFSRPEQAQLGEELLWVVNYLGALRAYQALYWPALGPLAPGQGVRDSATLERGGKQCPTVKAL